MISSSHMVSTTFRESLEFLTDSWEPLAGCIVTTT